MTTAFTPGAPLRKIRETGRVYFVSKNKMI